MIKAVYDTNVIVAALLNPDGLPAFLLAAIHWYEQGEVSQEKAARIAGMDRTDFLAALARDKANVFVVDFDDLKRELA